MRQCPFDGCAVLVPDRLFGCPRHWNSLSPKQKQRIYTVYDDYLNGFINLATLRRYQGDVLDEAHGRVSHARPE